MGNGKQKSARCTETGPPLTAHEPRFQGLYSLYPPPHPPSPPPCFPSKKRLLCILLNEIKDTLINGHIYHCIEERKRFDTFHFQAHDYPKNSDQFCMELNQWCITLELLLGLLYKGLGAPRNKNWLEQAWKKVERISKKPHNFYLRFVSMPKILCFQSNHLGITPVDLKYSGWNLLLITSTPKKKKKTENNGLRKAGLFKVPFVRTITKDKLPRAHSIR